MNWYLPQSDPGHHLTTATKMSLAHNPATLDRNPLHTLRICAIFPQPGIFQARHQEWGLSVGLLDLSFTLFRRPPPGASID
jgi:hypothetical protein